MPCSAYIMCVRSLFSGQCSFIMAIFEAMSFVYRTAVCFLVGPAVLGQSTVQPVISRRSSRSVVTPKSSHPMGRPRPLHKCLAHGISDWIKINCTGSRCIWGYSGNCGYPRMYSYPAQVEDHGDWRPT